MAGVLFIILVPQKEHEVSLHKNDNSQSKVLKRSQGNVHRNISKTDLHYNGLDKSKREITLNVSEMESGESYLKSSWGEIKQALKSKRNKLKITRPVRSVDVLDAFHWDTPLETILSEVINRLDVKSATWCATKNNLFWQVTFTLESGGECEEALQVLRGFGIGSRHQSSLSLVPCTLFYRSSEKLMQEDNEKVIYKTGPWSRFSSSVRARTNLAQVLHDVKADAAVTFDWCFRLLVAALVAGIGLVENSTVVLVASMLISPLLGPITACTLGTAVRDRSLQMIGVTHELLGLFLCLLIGFIFGLAICIVDGQFSIMSDWPTSEMMYRCKYRSLWVGMMVAIPSGAGVALAVLGDYTASLVGVAISASLLPPAVNAGLLWAMSLYRLISPNDMTWRIVQPSELAVLGTRSLCLTLLNILCIFLAGVSVYKVKKVCPLEQRDINWWSANKSRSQTNEKHNANAWEIYSKSSSDSSEESKKPQGQNETFTFRQPRVHVRTENLNTVSGMSNGIHIITVPKPFEAPPSNGNMPSGVIFIVCIPSSNYEHILKFGKEKSLVLIEENYKPQLAVELRDKKSRSASIPMHLTHNYYNASFSRNMENIIEDDEFFTMESIIQELLSKLHVEHVVWVPDKAGSYVQVMFPLPTGDQCETMLHCLTQLGIGVKSKSIVNVVPCNVVHSAVENEDSDDENILRKNEDARKWRSFVDSIRSKLTVKQVVDGVRCGGELSFDYLTLIITADSLAALGLVENNASNIVAAMLVSPLMGPVMSITFGTIISDRSLVRSGFESLVAGMFFSLVFGFIFGLILGSTDMPWGFGDWPTEEMKSRGNVRSLWMGVLWALTSGTGVALALLQGSAGPLIGIAISASLLPPVVNCGLYWALACIWLLYPGVKIPHIKGEPYIGNSSYQPLYHDYLPIEFAINGIVSCCLTIVNVICIFITAIIFLKIKEVAAPYTSSPDLRRFWEQDIRVVRESNRAHLHKAEDDERHELIMDDLNQETDEEMKNKLESAIQEALDDETYRKVKRMSYQSHNADEVIRTIGFQPKSSTSKRSSLLDSSTSTPIPAKPKADDIAILDKLLTSLLGIKENKRRSFTSHRGSPRTSNLPVITELRQNRRSESWPDRIHEDSVVRGVINNLRTSKRNSQVDDPFLTPK